LQVYYTPLQCCPETTATLTNLSNCVKTKSRYISDVFHRPANC